MEWSDEAIVLSVRPHGETSAIVEVLARTHGRHMGLVRGGASRSKRPTLQPGNTLRAQWRARLSEHLGNFSVEPVKSRAGDMLDSGDALAGLNAFAGVAGAALPEREPHESVYHAAEILLDAIAEDDFAHWAPLYVRWEAGLLEALGFGLDLTRCAATGGVDDLIYVSPRSGRAVSAGAGEAYRDRLFALPSFLLGSQNASPTRADIAAGLRLTEYFLLERVLAPHSREMPSARLRLDELATRESE
ncbi:MAG: DNA repair protein RecO [Rhizomicrobium sp.]|jgi:DNA repair protein RecO (recombination protein O)